MNQQPPAPTYRKKDVRYTAVQIKGEWFDWPEGTPPDGIPCGPVIDPQNRSLMVKTPEGKMHGYVGDYLVTGPDGVMRVYEKGLFEETFDLATDNHVCYAAGCDSRCIEPLPVKETSDAADNL